MAPTALVHPLFDGPLDIVGDVHGEIDALRHLLGHLGYGDDGTHPAGRRLVFVGDLIDRGPDSPGVVALVRKLVVAGRAQCVVGNHELNVLREARKKDNQWFFDALGVNERDAMSEFFRSLPLALERDDLRVAHACWDDAAVAQVRDAEDVVGTLHRFHAVVEADLNEWGVADRLEQSLAHQNRNPVKLVTSGPERRANPAVEVNGELREAERVAWWSEYEGPLAVFGNSWRVKLVGDPDHGHLFDDCRPHALLGRGRAMCIDYSVGKRPRERRGKPTGVAGRSRRGSRPCGTRRWSWCSMTRKSPAWQLSKKAGMLSGHVQCGSFAPFVAPDLSRDLSPKVCHRTAVRSAYLARTYRAG